MCVQRVLQYYQLLEKSVSDRPNDGVREEHLLQRVKQRKLFDSDLDFWLVRHHVIILLAAPCSSGSAGLSSLLIFEELWFPGSSVPVLE